MTRGSRRARRHYFFLRGSRIKLQLVVMRAVDVINFNHCGLAIRHDDGWARNELLIVSDFATQQNLAARGRWSTWR